MSSEAMPLPAAEPTAHKVYPEKISTIVDQIAQLNLLEVADLNELLKVSIITFLCCTASQKFPRSWSKTPKLLLLKILIRIG